MSSYNIEIPEDSTISLLKDKICDASGILKSQLVLEIDSCNDEDQLWKHNLENQTSLNVFKVIQVMIEKKSGNISAYRSLKLTNALTLRISHEGTTREGSL